MKADLLLWLQRSSRTDGSAMTSASVCPRLVQCAPFPAVQAKFIAQHLTHLLLHKVVISDHEFVVHHVVQNKHTASMTTDRLECKFAEFDALPLTLEQSTAALPPPQHPAKVRATPGTFLGFCPSLCKSTGQKISQTTSGMTSASLSLGPSTLHCSQSHFTAAVMYARFE